MYTAEELDDFEERFNQLGRSRKEFEKNLYESGYSDDEIDIIFNEMGLL